jgi:hypothetical protein
MRIEDHKLSQTSVSNSALCSVVVIRSALTVVLVGRHSNNYPFLAYLRVAIGSERADMMCFFWESHTVIEANVFDGIDL